MVEGPKRRRGRPIGSRSSGPTGGGRKINIFIPAGLVPNLERAAQRENMTAAQWVKNKVLTLLRLEGETG